VINRKDCCQDRLVGTVVELLDTNKNVVYTSSPLSSADVQDVSLATVATNGLNVAKVATNVLNVTLYMHSNYLGEYATKGIGNYDIGSMGLPNDAISSIRVPQGLKIQLFQHHNFGGEKIEIDADISSLEQKKMSNGVSTWNDQVSSFKVVANLPAAPPKLSPAYWERIPGVLKNVSVSGDLMCGTNKDNTIYCSENKGKSWHTKPGKLAQMSLDGKRACGVNGEEKIYCVDDITKLGVDKTVDWQWVSGDLKNISVSGDRMCGVNRDDQIYCAPYNTNNWKQVPGFLRQISLKGKQACGTQRNNKIFCSNDVVSGAPPNWINVPGDAAEVQVKDATTMCGIAVDGKIYCSKDKVNGGWVEKEGILATLSLDGNKACGVQGNGDIYCSTNFSS
jgi:hypothetical protein